LISGFVGVKGLHAHPQEELMDETRAPPLSDPRWKEWSQPLLDFLQTPRNWKQLNAWCRETKFNGAKLRHCLAWLETFGHIYSLDQEGVLFWVASVIRVGEVTSEFGPPGEPSMQN
jgi:hypothetical protein